MGATAKQLNKRKALTLRFAVAAEALGVILLAAALVVVVASR